MDKFLENYISTSTKKQYRSIISNVEKELGDLSKVVVDTKLIKDFIDSQKVGLKNKQDKHYAVCSYLIHLKRKPYEFERAPVERKKRELPDKESLKLIKNEQVVTNKIDKLLLDLLLNYPQVLRTDLADVKIRNFNDTEAHYKDGQIIFPQINKTKYKNITIKLTENDKQLVEDIMLTNMSDYLILMRQNNGKNTQQDRNNNYSKLIVKLSKKYLGLKLTQTDFRGISATSDVVNANLDEEFLETIKKLEELAKQRGHSLKTSINKYVNLKK